MKGLKQIAVMLIIVLLTAVMSQSVYALSDNELFKFNGKTITKTTTVAQINSMFGNPKLTTESAFGGNAYSYYDNDYTWYLHIETNANGKIVAYGGISNNFEGKRYKYGDKEKNSLWYLSGTTLTRSTGNDYTVYGIYEYNCDYNDQNTYWENYKKDSSKYLYNLQQHSIIVSKVIAKQEGHDFDHTICSEDMFYINEQLKYNGTDIYNYANNNGKRKNIGLIVWGTGPDFYSDLPNPIMLGGKTSNYDYSGGYKYVLYDLEILDYTSKKSKLGVCFINPSILDEMQTVELTDEEKAKLAAVQAEYNKYIMYSNNINPLYDEEPNYTSLPLKAGKFNDNALYAATAWLNLARVGIGLPAVELDKNIADSAQHKAVMVYYASQKGLESGHNMKKPDGVSEEFYNTAQEYMNENLFYGDIQSSIGNALNDGYGDPVTCGHRYNLLGPNYTKWGVGSAGKGLSFNIQGCHKLSGNSGASPELVAWPSNGICPTELIYNGIGNWTANFYNKKYSVTSETEVTIKCLNTGVTYEITNQNKNESHKFLKVSGDSLITFRDDNIVYEDGYVFEITLHNVKNNSTNQKQDYTYRSVFKDFYNSETSSNVTDITLDKTSVNMIVGQNVRILAKVKPENATNKLMKFSTSEENIVKVRQDGTLTALKTGKATITITCGSVTKKVNVEVSDGILGDITQDGQVDAQDATLIMLYKVGTKTLTPEQLKLADINGDTQVDAQDATKIMLMKIGKK